MLTYLGIDNVRQTSPIDAASMANLTALGQLGAKIDLVINGGGPVSLSGAIQSVYQLAPYLNAVEGPDEVVNYPMSYHGLSGVDAAVALQKDMYAAVKADPALDHASVYMFSLGGVDVGSYPSIGDMSAYTDYANVHSYPPQGLRPIFVIHAAIDANRIEAPSKPVVLTETGFFTLTDGVGWGGVTQTMQASYLLDEVLDEAVAGVARTYLYDLIDDGADPNGSNQEDHFGLYNFDGTPKLAATAFHNLTTILSDTGASSRSFTPAAFAFTATGVPYNYTGNTTSFQKSDGTNVIAVWNEEPTWNTTTLTPIAAQHFPVTVNLEATYATVTVVDPLLGTGAIQTLHNVSSVTLDITDHPLLIVIPPASAAAGTTTGANTSVTVPVSTPVSVPVSVPATVTVPVSVPVTVSVPVSVPVTVPVSVPVSVPVVTPTAGLVVNVAEDAWQGDAQFIVTVDGAQVGGTFSATASNAAGQSQAIAVATTLADGVHQVGVSFINDAYGGPGADRNFYVTAASYNGQAIAGAADPLYSNGTDRFGVTVGTPVTTTAAATTTTTGTTPPTSGSGLVVNVAEDAWQGDAQFTVSVDGAQVGGPYTATASHAAGQSQAISIATTLTSGAHQVGISFINDAYGGSGADRNFYVTGASYNGQAISGAAAPLYSNGTDTFGVTNGTAPTSTAPTSTPLTSTPLTSTATINVSEDAYQGDAQFTVAVDGKQIGGVYKATASHAAGQSQAVSIPGIAESFTAHDIAITFLNDAYGGSPAADRNLYVNSVQMDNQAVPSSAAALFSNQTVHISALAPSTYTG